MITGDVAVVIRDGKYVAELVVGLSDDSAFGIGFLYYVANLVILILNKRTVWKSLGKNSAYIVVGNMCDVIFLIGYLYDPIFRVKFVVNKNSLTNVRENKIFLFLVGLFDGGCIEREIKRFSLIFNLFMFYIEDVVLILVSKGISFYRFFCIYKSIIHEAPMYICVCME